MLWSTDSSNASLRRARLYAEVMGLTRYGSDLLLAALAEDRTVAEALDTVGVRAEAVRAAAGISQQDHAEAVRRAGLAQPIDQMRFPAPEVREVMSGAEAEAASREHYFVEPGHLVLAMEHRSSSPGHRLLRALTSDVARVYERLADALPAEETSEEQLLLYAQRYPRLPEEESRRLARDLAQRNRTRPLLAIEKDQLTGEQRAALEERRASLARNPALQLNRHHVHVVIEAAVECARRGHRFPYAFYIAEQAQIKASNRFTDPDERYSDFVRRSVKAALGQLDPLDRQPR